jgi:hypothetical protein
MQLRNKRAGQTAICLSLLAGLFAAVARPASAEHVPAPQLFPRDTVAFARISDSRQLKERFMNTAMGRMSQDPELKPLLDALYGSLVDAFGVVEAEIGLSLDELLNIPQGEFAIGAVAVESTEPGGGVRGAAIIDAGEQLDSAKKLIERAETQLAADGRERKTETVGDVELACYLLPGVNDDLVFFHRDQTAVICLSRAVAKQILENWDGKEDANTLAKNPRYAAIMKRCQDSKDHPPEATFFVDPIALVRAATQGNPVAQAGLAVLPIIGLDGFSGVGGSMTFDLESYDQVMHLHVLLENPRTGALKMLALGSGDVTPQRWVPDDVVAYMTGYWDARTTYDQLAELVDSFQGSGTLNREVERQFSDNLGVDFQKEVLDAVSGRVTMATWFERPVRFGSETRVVTIDLKDGKATQGTLDRLAEKYKELLTKQELGVYSYYRIEVPEPRIQARRRQGNQNESQDDTNPPPVDEELAPFQPPRFSPCVAVIDDVLVISDREATFKGVASAWTNASSPLVDSDDYKRVAAKIKRIARGGEAGFATFDQPEEAMRALYEMANGEQVKTLLGRGAESNQLARDVRDAMEKHPLPPFSVIQKYLAPGGSVLVDEPTGFHYTAFSLKREE